MRSAGAGGPPIGTPTKLGVPDRGRAIRKVATGHDVDAEAVKGVLFGDGSVAIHGLEEATRKWGTARSERRRAERTSVTWPGDSRIQPPRDAGWLRASHQMGRADVTGSRKPLVTIVVPVWNGQEHLGESLDSILAQDYDTIEILVMDDASTDTTPAILEEYAGRVEVHRQPHNKGIYATMNDGIALARGEYIAVYHADDLYEPQIVSRQAAFLDANPDVGGVFASDVFIDAAGREIGRLELPSSVPTGEPLTYAQVLTALLRYKNHFLRCPSAMIRASTYAEMGGYRPDLYRNTSDLDLYLRLARDHGLAVLGEYLFRYRRGHGASSERYQRLRTETENFFLIMDAYLAEGGADIVPVDALRAYEAHRAQDWLMISVNRYILGDMDEARVALANGSARRLLASGAVQRWRLGALHGLMTLLVRLPRQELLAAAFRRHWTPDPPRAGLA